MDPRFREIIDAYRTKLARLSDEEVLLMALKHDVPLPPQQQLELPAPATQKAPALALVPSPQRRVTPRESIQEVALSTLGNGVLDNAPMGFVWDVEIERLIWADLHSKFKGGERTHQHILSAFNGVLRRRGRRHKMVRLEVVTHDGKEWLRITKVAEHLAKEAM